MSAALETAQVKASHVWERDEHDWYVEPEVATEALLTVERFVGRIWDTSCGQGNIVRTLRRAGYVAQGSDVVQRVNPTPLWFARTADFLADWPERAPPVDADNIVMNPPFFRAKGAEAFIRKALAVARGKVAAFVDIRFLAGANRATGLFLGHPPSRAWIITPRVSCPPGSYLAAGNKAGNGSSDWCWLVWDLTAPRRATEIGWLYYEPGRAQISEAAE